MMHTGFHDYACSISDIESKATNLGDIYLSGSNFDGYTWSLNSMIDLVYRKLIFAILFESGNQICQDTRKDFVFFLYMNVDI